MFNKILRAYRNNGLKYCLKRIYFHLRLCVFRTKFHDRLNSIPIKLDGQLKPGQEIENFSFKNNIFELLSTGKDPQLHISNLNIDTSKYKLKLTVRTSTFGEIQLYWDSGFDFSEKNSSKLTLINDDIYHDYIFNLPAEHIISLRIDPLNNPGTIYLKNILLMPGKTKGTQHSEIMEILYRIWQTRNQYSDSDRTKDMQQLESFTYKPLISILMPVYNIDQIFFTEALQSVCHQIYQNWELCIVNDGSTMPHIKEILDCYSQKSPKVKSIQHLENEGIVAETRAKTNDLIDSLVANEEDAQGVEAERAHNE